MEAVSKIYLKLRYYFKLWRLNLDLKSVSEDACLRSKGKSFHNFDELIFPYCINYEISLRATEVIKSVFHSCL